MAAARTSRNAQAHTTTRGIGAPDRWLVDRLLAARLVARCWLLVADSLVVNRRESNALATGGWGKRCAADLKSLVSMDLLDRSGLEIEITSLVEAEPRCKTY